jgi:hypothetical protein
VGHDEEQLTYEQVASEFERTAPAVAGPERPTPD